MKKKVLLFFVIAMLSIMGAKADVIPSSYYSEPAEGTFYLYNVTQEKFLNASGENTSLTTTPKLITLTASGTAYKIVSTSSKELKIGYWGNHRLWWNGTGDTEAYKWYFTTSGTNTYKVYVTLTTAITENGVTFPVGNNYMNSDNDVPSLEESANDWALITEEGYSSFQSGAAGKKYTIIAANGDATSLITNPSFEDTDVSAWTGGVRKTNINTWRGNGLCDYENADGSDATFSQTLSNMPAGTYKVVAAVRGAIGTTATASINGTAGSTITNKEFTDNVQINYNGVQMPKPTFTSEGFNTATYALGWKWATATYTLAADGNLTISFEMNGSGFRGIDDVHLYYMGDAENTYAVAYTDGVSNTGHAVTCDLITDNPNKVWISASDITTAASAVIKNNFPTTSGWQGFYWVNSLVLYDGYEFTPPTDKTFKAVNSTLYRNIDAGAFATICCPFQITGGADGTFYQPESLTNGTLNFETVETKEGGKAYLYKASSAVTALTGPGDALLASSPVANGTGVNMVGTYTNIDAIDYDDYVLSGTDLYRVNSTVSLKPFRAYFTIPGVSSARIAIGFDDETTGIKNLTPALSEGEGAVYDLQGRRVAQPTKGLYIVNGKKVMVK